MVKTTWSPKNNHLTVSNTNNTNINTTNKITSGGSAVVANNDNLLISIANSK